MRKKNVKDEFISLISSKGLVRQKISSEKGHSIRTDGSSQFSQDFYIALEFAGDFNDSN